MSIKVASKVRGSTVSIHCRKVKAGYMRELCSGAYIDHLWQLNMPSSYPCSLPSPFQAFEREDWIWPDNTQETIM